MDEADIDEDPDDMVIISSQGDPGKFLTDEDMVNDGDSLVAALVKEGGGNEKLNMTIVSDRAVWIVSGNNWGFHVQPIEETHINKEVPVPIKLSSFWRQEHKFAVVSREPEDKNYWTAELYSLDREDENATLEIKHVSDDEISVKLIYNQGNASTTLKPVQVCNNNGELVTKTKIFSKEVVNSRKETLTNSVAIGGFVLTAISTVVGIVALAPAAAASGVAGAAAAGAAKLMK